MKMKVSALMVALLLSVFALQGRAAAQLPAYQTAFTSSITYQNVGSAPANISLEVYNTSGGTFSPSLAPLAVNGAGSYFVGQINALGTSFNGSAVMSADQPVVATIVQVPTSTTVKNRPLSNGFSSGSNSVLVATVLKNTAGYNSKVVIQNTDSAPNNFMVEFVSAATNTVFHTINQTNVAPNTSVYYDAGTIVALGAAFNGSMRITATKTTGGGAGSAVATSLELEIAGNGAYAFQGVPSTSAATTVYMATALCNLLVGGVPAPNNKATTAYAIQNTGAALANVTITYKGAATTTQNLSIPAGSKLSANPCTAGAGDGFTGSATIVSSQPIVAIGKVFGAGLTTAFEGATAGAAKIALPYARWLPAASGGQQTFIAIQNIGGSPVGPVTVKYYTSAGVLAGTQTIATIASGAKAGSSPFGATPSLTNFGSGGGSAIIEGPAGSSLIAIARIQTPLAGGGAVAEDYNGQPVE